MALKIADFFARADAKSRVLIVIVAIVTVSLVIYAGIQFFSSDSTTGSAQVASAPVGLQSVPGSQLSSEYARALQQANTQAAQQAQMTGGSAVPTLVNVAQPDTQCAPACEDAADVASDINSLVASGKLTQEDANVLLDLAKNNASLGEYEAALADLVKQGKLTPEQARKMLETYRKQHANNVAKISAQTMDGLIRSGKLSLGTATQLLSLQKQNVPPSQYADELNRLVREGKLSPDVAAALLAQYKQQYAQAAAQDGIAGLRQMAKSGQISAEAADTLSGLQKAGASMDTYQAALGNLVATGKMTPETAAKLLDQYKNQLAGGSSLPGKPVVAGSVVASGQLEKMTAAVSEAEQEAAGELAGLEKVNLSNEDAKALLDLQNKNASPDELQKALSDLVRSGKLSPNDAKKILDKYTQSHEMATDLNNEVNGLVNQGKISPEMAAILNDPNVSPETYQKTLEDLVKAGKLSPEEAKRLLDKSQALRDSKDGFKKIVQTGLAKEDADKLLALQKKNVSPAAYQQALQDLVSNGKLSAEDAKRLNDRYQKLAALRVGKKLAELEDNNATPADYANELKNAIKSGALTPQQAAALLQKYQDAQREKQAALAKAAAAAATPAGPAVTANTSIPGGEALAQLQQSLQQSQQPGAETVSTGPEINVAQFEQEEAKERAAANAAASEARQKRLEALMAAMSTQSQQLVSAWQQPVTMQHKEAAQNEKKSTSGLPGGGTGGNDKTATTVPAGPPIIKAGSILFAVLDTAADSDYPDSPVMATVVQGKFKGAKLMGKLAVVSGKDRVSLTFNMMDMDNWDTTKAVTAFAIDPETARTVLASSVNYHYLLRYGSMIATSFVTGYSNAITQAGTSTSSIFGNSTTHNPLSPSDKLAVGVGQVGTTIGTAMQSYFNTPPTIKVNAGVALGVLFMADVTEGAQAPASNNAGAAGAATTGVPAGAATANNVQQAPAAVSPGAAPAASTQPLLSLPASNALGQVIATGQNVATGINSLAGQTPP